MKKQLLALAIVIAFATSLQASVKTTHTSPGEITTPALLLEIQTLPIEIKTPINKIVDPNLKDIQQTLFNLLDKGIQTVVDIHLKEINRIVTPLDKDALLKLHNTALTLHQTYKTYVTAFEMALLALERNPLNTRSYNNLISRLTDLYNGHPSTLLGTSTANKIYKLVATFADKLNQAANEYNNSISSVAPKLHKVTGKGQHFIAYAIGRIAIYQSQIMSINKAKAKTTSTVPYGSETHPTPGKGKMKINHGPVINNNK